MAKATSTKHATRSPPTGFKNLTQETLTAVNVEAPVSPYNSASEKNVASQSTNHKNCTKKIELVEGWWAGETTDATTMAAKAVVKVAAKTSKWEQSDLASKTMTTSVSRVATVVDCEMVTATSTAYSRLVPIYDSKGNAIGMNQVPVVPSAVPLVQDIPKGKAAHHATYKKLGALKMEEPEDRSSDSRSDYESEPEG